MAARESRAPEAPLDAAIGALVGSTPELAALVGEFLKDALAEFRYLLKHGSPPVKAKLLSNLGAALVRGTTVRQEEDEDDKKVRAAFEMAMRNAREDIEAKAPDTAGLGDVDDG